MDKWVEGEGMLDRLTDPRAANRWKRAGVPDGEDPGSGPGAGSRNRPGADGDLSQLHILGIG